MTTPQFEFADESPARPGRKHRRGRGYTPPNRKGAAPANRNTSTTSRLGSAYNSLRSGGHKGSSAASKASSKPLSPQSQKQKPQTNYNFATSDAWDNANNTSIRSKDDNSCAGSLTYSASSSVRSEESSNESSFADILKVIDCDGDGSSDVKEFMAKQSKAASYGCYAATGGGQYEKEGASNNAAVQGWMQRVESRQAAAQQQKQASQQQKQKAQAKGLKQKFTMANPKHVPTNSNVDLNYSKDDSSESDDVFGVDFDDNVLETIGGLDDDGVVRPTNVSVTSQSKSPAGNPFRSKEPQQTSPTFNTSNIVSSAPSSPRSKSSGHVTPPPNSRHKRTSTPPGAINPISRTNSRHSKSSSDGSFDTPAPSSPPLTKPPHARSAPVTKTRRSKTVKSEEKAVTDPEAFYAKSWMCGFTDAFSFDGFDQFSK